MIIPPYIFVCMYIVHDMRLNVNTGGTESELLGAKVMLIPCLPGWSDGKQWPKWFFCHRVYSTDGHIEVSGKK